MHEGTFVSLLTNAKVPVFIPCSTPQLCAFSCAMSPLPWMQFVKLTLDINVCISKPGIQMKNEKSGFLGVMGPVPCEEPRTTFNLWVGGVFVVSLHPGKAVWEGCWEIHFLALSQISR